MLERAGWYSGPSRLIREKIGQLLLLLRKRKNLEGNYDNLYEIYYIGCSWITLSVETGLDLGLSLVKYLTSKIEPKELCSFYPPFRNVLSWKTAIMKNVLLFWNHHAVRKPKLSTKRERGHKKEHEG